MKHPTANLLVVTAVLSGALWCVAHGLGPPSREQVEEVVSRGGDRLLEYRVIAGSPHALYARADYHGEYDLAVLEHLERSRLPSGLPPEFRWYHRTGSRYHITYTLAPASLGTAHCTGVRHADCDTESEVFGQINSREISTLEVNLGGERRRYPVSYPGFILRLEGFRGAPTDYRWRDADDRTVWDAERDPSKAAAYPL